MISKKSNQDSTNSLTSTSPTPEKTPAVLRRSKYMPGKYKPEYALELIELMGQGLFNCQIITKWGISPASFDMWINKKADFKDAYARGMAANEAWMLSKAQQHLEAGDDS